MRFLSGDSLAPLLARRFLLGALTLWVVSMVIFTATQLLPGDAARAILGRGMSPVRLHALQVQLHLDRPPVVQYAIWLGNALRGDFGTSLVSGLPVLALVGPKIENSLCLLLMVLVVSVPVSLLAGIGAALLHRRGFDLAASLLALVIAAVPEFIIGIVLIMLFATVLFHWLPPVSIIRPGLSVFANPWKLVLPVATLTLTTFPYMFRMIRASMIDVLDSEYIEMAKLTGVPLRRMIFNHALPNAIAPAIQAIALTCAYLAGGIVLVEYIFGFPGVGQYLVSVVSARDLPAIQCIVLFLAGFYVAVNILADVISILVTPRLRVRSWG